MASEIKSCSVGHSLQAPFHWIRGRSWHLQFNLEGVIAALDGVSGDGRGRFMEVGASEQHCLLKPKNY